HWNMAPPPVPPALLNVRAGVRVSQCAVQTCDTFDDCLFRIAAALTRRHLTLGVNYYWALSCGAKSGSRSCDRTSAGACTICPLRKARQPAGHKFLMRRFESCRPSQKVASLWGMSGLQKFARHSGELASGWRVSEAPFSRFMIVRPLSELYASVISRGHSLIPRRDS